MLKVSSQSWHYRYFRYLESVRRGPQYVNPFYKGYRPRPDVPHSLCPYFWSLVLGTIGASLILAIVAVGTVVVAPFFALGWAGVWVFHKLPERTRTKKPKTWTETPSKPRRVRQPSLVKETARAFKNKVCPLLEVVD